MLEGTINILDIIGAIILISIIIIIVNFYKNSKIEKSPEYKYLTFGLITKLFGAVALAFIYTFYYGGGDTTEYFKGGKILSNLLFEKPIDYFRLLLSNSGNFAPDLKYINKSIWYSRSNEEWFMVKIVSVINLFSFNRYLISNIYISMFAFMGAWHMFKSFNYFFPKKYSISFISIFLLPSVIFWGSGILKDTITLSALGIFFYYFTMIVFKNKYSIINFIILFITGYIIIKLKAYILIGFIPGLLIGVFINYKNKIKNSLVRKVLSPIFLVGVSIFGTYTLISVMAVSEEYKIDGIEQRAKGFHSWHTTLGGSTYNLGEIEYTPIGILKKVPEAVNVTFFRPYLWEANSAVTLLSSIESLVLFLLFSYTLLKFRIRWFTTIFKNKFLTLAFVYTIFFGFAVGFTSYNFGALARYKIPVLPFFGFILLYFYSEIKVRKSLKN